MESKAYELLKEEDNWWFIGKKSVIKAFLGRTNPIKMDILDIGPGFGGNMDILSMYGDVDVIEPYTVAHSILKQRGVRKILNIDNFPNCQIEGQYNLITMLDSLEHIQDDEKALSVVKGLLANNGELLITVPAHQWLWSKHDEIHKHCRRYSKRDLIKKLKEEGFVIEKVSYFMTTLFPLAVLQRFINKNRENRKIPKVINILFKCIFSFEGRLLSYVNFPFGLSLGVLCRKNIMK